MSFGRNFTAIRFRSFSTVSVGSRHPGSLRLPEVTQGGPRMVRRKRPDRVEHVRMVRPRRLRRRYRRIA